MMEGIAGINRDGSCIIPPESSTVKDSALDIGSTSCKVVLLVIGHGAQFWSENLPLFVSFYIIKANV